jgi:hypothetical protein
MYGRYQQQVRRPRDVDLVEPSVTDANTGVDSTQVILQDDHDCPMFLFLFLSLSL